MKHDIAAMRFNVALGRSLGHEKARFEVTDKGQEWLLHWHNEGKTLDGKERGALLLSSEGDELHREICTKVRRHAGRFFVKRFDDGKMADRRIDVPDLEALEVEIVRIFSPTQLC